jgi:hypothetical protein
LQNRVQVLAEKNNELTHILDNINNTIVQQGGVYVTNNDYCEQITTISGKTILEDIHKLVSPGTKYSRDKVQDEVANLAEKYKNQSEDFKSIGKAMSLIIEELKDDDCSISIDKFENVADFVKELVTANKKLKEENEKLKKGD